MERKSVRPHKVMPNPVSDTEPNLFEENPRLEMLEEGFEVPETAEKEYTVKPFDPAYSTTDSGEHASPLLRRPSVLQRVQLLYLFFNQKLKNERWYLVKKFAMIYLIMAVFVLGIFSIYWGSYFNRNKYYSRLKFLVVNADDSTIDGIPPYIGNTIETLVGAAPQLGIWNVFNSTAFAARVADSGRTFEEEITNLIHKQKYWGAIFIKPNATYNLYEALSSGNAQYDARNNTIETIYETGRDFLNMHNIMLSVETINHQWLGLQSNVTSSILSHVLNFTAAIAPLVATPLPFVETDLIPFTNAVLIAPSQVGLIYMIILTFFQFNFFGEVHAYTAKLGLRPLLFVLYRVFASIGSFFVLSLVFSFVSLAMQVDFTVTFGHSGFLVYWMIVFMTMWVVGMANEIAGMLLILVYPPMLGFWMLFWVIVNISATFLPIVLLPRFYRFGYAMPIHNSLEITKVILFNTCKDNFGRHIAILIVWMVILTLALPVTAKFFGQTMGRRAKEAAQKQAQEQPKK